MDDFEAVYRTYFTSVYRYLLRLTGNARTAEEITSETFFKAMRAYPRFHGRCDVRVWLCQIAKNTYFSSQKSAARLSPLDDESMARLPSGDDAAVERIIRMDDASMLRSLLHQLPQPQQEVFMWRVFAELPCWEIGKIFGKTENWACVTYHRARMQIRRKMEERQHEE